MTTQPNTLASLRTLAGLALALAASACTTAASVPAAVTPAAEAPNAQASSGITEMCTTVRRGERGQVRDARIAEHWPNRNYGTASATFAGEVAGGKRQSLLHFELPAIPAGATIVSAKVQMHKPVCGGAGVSAHRVLRAWDETSVTWSSFDGAYEPKPAADVMIDSADHTTIDVTELATGWANGTIDNHGLLLAQTVANTSFSTSEVADPSERPTLEVCWTTGS